MIALFLKFSFGKFIMHTCTCIHYNICVMNIIYYMHFFLSILFSILPILLFLCLTLDPAVSSCIEDMFICLSNNQGCHSLLHCRFLPTAVELLSASESQIPLGMVSVSWYNKLLVYMYVHVCILIVNIGSASGSD